MRVGIMSETRVVAVRVWGAGSAACDQKRVCESQEARHDLPCFTQSLSGVRMLYP